MIHSLFSFIEILNIDKEGVLLDQNENVEGNSPLQIAIKIKNRELALMIMSKCTPDQINHRNYRVVTALHMAVESRIGKKINPFKRFIPLLELSRDLLNAGADAFVFDDGARLPLFALCQNNVDLYNLCDILMNMLERKNRGKLDELAGDDVNGTENGNSYVF